MKYQHRFRVHAPLESIAEFHSRSTSMGAITPPPILVRMHQSPAVLADGDEMSFTMWLGPLPVKWLARIEAVSPNGFTDRQMHGPFAEWAHKHTFVSVDENTTDVLDEITIRLRFHLLWGPVGLGMLLGLPVLFAFRGWKTRKMINELTSI